ncbi:MAG: acetate kinase [bacterium]|nr:acetate kinase [bacterium]MDT8366652.1 acetate kinase [bacterium]
MPILVFNCGSSSIKHTLYEKTSGEVIHHGVEERVTDYNESLEKIFSDLDSLLSGGLSTVEAVGHRVVHGGWRFRHAHLIDPQVMEGIRSCSELAPLHNPPNITGIEFATHRLPDTRQIAVFDTSFHSSIPPEAYNYALPIELAKELKIRRYGFHGISHNFVHDRAADLYSPGDGDGFGIITCHLGYGCSLAAVRDGRCVDTSMGFTPLEGLVMGTRCGDLDPAIVHYLMSAEGGGLADDQIHDLLNRESGLKGLSGLSADVRDLLAARSQGHEGAALALSVFTYRLKKYICAYHGVLGGADALVFTAGIGENSPEIRSETLEGLGPLGFVLDEAKNNEAKGVEAEITGEGSTVRIFVIPTDEDLMIYKETLKIIKSER